MNLKVSVIQSDLFWEDRKRNLDHFTQMVSKVKDSDLIVLPEMFATGFSMNTNLAEDFAKGDSILWLLDQTKKINAAICGSLMIKDNGGYYNRLYFVEPSGLIHTYNKRHLFSLAKEEMYYSKGREQKIVQYKSWNIALQICYDLRFPVWSRRNKSYDYDLLIYVANWPERRSYAWKSLLVSRAVENQSFVIGSNRVGQDFNQVLHSGDSQILNPLGVLMASAHPFRQEIISAELSKESLMKIRDSLPFYSDSDSFTII
jgi:predicted amidohydrolase